MTPEERSLAGWRGYVATYRIYGEAQMNAWRRMGGRRRYLTNAELREREKAGTEHPRGARSTSRTKGVIGNGSTGATAGTVAPTTRGGVS